MPTPISHAAVGLAIGAWTAPAPRPTTRVCALAAACAALPDIDVLWSAGLPESSPFAHRALTHSLAFAVVATILVTSVGFRHDRARLAVTLGLGLLSHSCLDALTTYSLGIAFFAPFSEQRFRFRWTPLGRPDGMILRQLAVESVFVLLPAVLLFWLGWRLRRQSAVSAPSS
ncbi:MAG TPA: metal-dependent hydrolase [Gemmatimonadales bacterium]